VLAVLLLIVLPFSFLGFVILIALLALYEVGLTRLAGRRPPPEEPSGTSDAAPTDAGGAGAPTPTAPTGA